MCTVTTYSGCNMCTVTTYSGCNMCTVTTVALLIYNLLPHVSEQYAVNNYIV